MIVRPSGVREVKRRTLSASVLDNAIRKARSVARLYPNRWILSADTLIAYRGRIYGKPRDRKEAVAVLSRLAGKTHELATGVVLKRGRREIRRVVRTRVTLRPLPAARIAQVLRHPERLAGGYAIRKRADPLVAAIQGSFTNVVGLPMEVVIPLLQKLKLAPRPQS